MSEPTEVKVKLTLKGLTALLRDLAADARDEGMDEVADAFEAVAALPEADRAKGIATLVRLGREFNMMHQRARVTQAQDRADFN